MKHFTHCFVCAFLFSFIIPMAQSETNIIITSFNNGILEWTNVDTQLYYNIEWKCSLSPSNTWTSLYRGCQDIQTADDPVSVPVPMFYRISGTSNPVNTKAISPSNTFIQAGYYNETSLDLIDADLVADNIKKDVDLFGVVGTYEGGGSAWPAPVPRTGQSTSYRTGDDGDLQPGVVWPSPRFTVNAATWTVTDNLTGLMWRRIADLNNGVVNWNAAIDNCNSLSEYGYGDWRLPTLKELLSIIDYRYQFPALCNAAGTGQYDSATHDPFYNVRDAGYWTSTTRNPVSSYKWYVDVSNGKVDYSSATVSYHYVWPVRDVD